ncbi:MAG: GxxExxY protein [Candidatus Sumerlaeia bacterium]
MDRTENEIADIIVPTAIEVHRTLGGPGLLECVYERALAWELKQAGLGVQEQFQVPVIYKGQVLGEPLRLDLLVDEKVIVECKATTQFHPVFQSQVLTYLRLSNLKLGFVINFGEKLVTNGIHRVANGLEDGSRRKPGD